VREHLFGQELTPDVRGPTLLKHRTSNPCFSFVARLSASRFTGQGSLVYTLLCFDTPQHHRTESSRPCRKVRLCGGRG
jgi:hypothetical protein